MNSTTARLEGSDFEHDLRLVPLDVHVDPTVVSALGPTL
jgi:hypothetical protein